MRGRYLVRFLFLSSVLFACVLAAAGCSKIGGDVSGTVTLNGKPLSSGVVVFHMDNGKSVSAAIASDGSYILQKPQKGNATISIETVQTPETNTNIASLAPGKPDPSNPANEKPAPKAAKIMIPDKYKNDKTSGFSITIGGGPQTLDIAMTGEAEKNEKK